MFRYRILPAALATAIAFGASGTAFASPGETENSKEIASVLGAKTSIAQAIAAAEQQTGGRAMKIGIEEEKGVYFYEIKTVTKDKVAEVFVDPTSGQVVRTDDEGLIAKAFDREDREEFAKLAASPTTLAAAIATAEQHVGGKAIEASFDNEDGAMWFEVEAVKDGAVHKVMIDAATGKVVETPAAESGERHED